MREKLISALDKKKIFPSTSVNPIWETIENKTRRSIIGHPDLVTIHTSFMVNVIVMDNQETIARCPLDMLKLSVHMMVISSYCYGQKWVGGAETFNL